MIDILEATDRCVMCGMCLPHCPTYGKSRNEADSPRGRIALIKALHSGELPHGGALVQHLDGCLTCRACEAVCPAAVPYGELIDAARQTLQQQRTKHTDPAQVIVDALVSRRWARQMAYRLLLAYQRFGIQKVMRMSGLLRLAGFERAESLLPKLEPAAPLRTGNRVDRDCPVKDRPKVALFTGCAAEIFDRATLVACQNLLTRLGHDVEIPPRQTCCGALHQHDGLPGKAQALMKQNVDAFDNSEIDAVISTASGCGAQLAEYPKYIDSNSAQRLAKRHKDICQFLAEQDWPRRTAFKPLAAKVAVHTSCSLTHVLKQARHALGLLARIPDIEFIELRDNTGCCGAAGSYMLRQPQMADNLLADIIDDLKSVRPDILVTSNIGCALHIAAGLRRAELRIPVVHPVVLLNEQLGDG